MLTRLVEPSDGSAPFLIATGDIAAGTCVLLESAMLSYRNLTDLKPDLQKLQRFRGLDIATTHSTCAAKVQHIADQMIAQHVCEPVRAFQLASIVYLHSVCVDDTKLCQAMFELFASAAHSCDPNCIMSTSSLVSNSTQSYQLRLIALKSIAAGRPITVSRCPNAMSQPIEVRRAVLLESQNRWCGCAKCTSIDTFRGVACRFVQRALLRKLQSSPAALAARACGGLMFPRWFAKCSDSVLEHTQSEFDPHHTNVSFECRWRCTSCSYEVPDSEVECFAPRRAELWVSRAIEKLETQLSQFSQSATSYDKVNEQTFEQWEIIVESATNLLSRTHHLVIRLTLLCGSLYAQLAKSMSNTLKQLLDPRYCDQFDEKASQDAKETMSNLHARAAQYIFDALRESDCAHAGCVGRPGHQRWCEADHDCGCVGLTQQLLDGAFECIQVAAGSRRTALLKQLNRYRSLLEASFGNPLQNNPVLAPRESHQRGTLKHIFALLDEFVAQQVPPTQRPASLVDPSHSQKQAGHHSRSEAHNRERISAAMGPIDQAIVHLASESEQLRCEQQEWHQRAEETMHARQRKKHDDHVEPTQNPTTSSTSKPTQSICQRLISKCLIC